MVMQYELSSHAAKRIRQRGIPQIIIDWLIQFGEKKRVKYGQALFFGKRGKLRMKQHLGRTYSKWDQMIASIYLVIVEQTIVTVGHGYKRFREA